MKWRGADIARWQKSAVAGAEKGSVTFDGETYRLLATWTGDVMVRAEPFDAIELDLSPLWAR